MEKYFLEVNHSKRTYHEFNKEYFAVRVNSHTSNCIMLGYTSAEVAIVMHVMLKEPKGTPKSNALGHKQHFLKSCLAIVIVGI